MRMIMKSGLAAAVALTAVAGVALPASAAGSHHGRHASAGHHVRAAQMHRGMVRPRVARNYGRSYRQDYGYNQDYYGVPTGRSVAAGPYGYGAPAYGAPEYGYDNGGLLGGGGLFGTGLFGGNGLAGTGIADDQGALGLGILGF